MDKNESGGRTSKSIEEMVTFCSKYKKIHVYGAGNAAMQIVNILQENEIVINDIIVSDEHKEKSELSGIAINEISDEQNIDGDGIVVATIPKYHSEIMCSITKHGLNIENIFFSDVCPKHDDSRAKSKYFNSYDLDTIGERCGTDKGSSYHDYLNKYEFIRRRWKDEKIVLLELGVLHGASLKMWHEYFKNANIYGVDIDKNCKKYETDNCIVLNKDLGKKDELESLCKLHPTVIIDDASHMWSHQIKSICYLFSSLQNGGIFIVEDLGTSFGIYASEGEYCDFDVSAYEFCSWLSEAVCSGQYLLLTERLEKLPQMLRSKVHDIAKQIEMISFIDGSCIMIKREHFVCD